MPTGLIFQELTSNEFDPPVVTQTTYYRRLVSSGSCGVLGKDNVVEVTVNPLPVVAFSAPSDVCQGESFTLSLSMSQGTAPIEYDYSAGSTTFANLIGTENTMIPISNFQQNTTYTLLRVRDLNGCVSQNVPQALRRLILSRSILTSRFWRQQRNALVAHLLSNGKWSRV